MATEINGYEPGAVRWLTYGDVRRLCGFDRPAVRALVRAGELEATGAGGSLVVSETSLERYLYKSNVPYQPRLF